MQPTFLFLITPVPNLAEEAHSALERAIRDMLPEFQVLLRNVANTTNSLFTGKDEDGRTRFIWVMELDLVTGDIPPDLGTALTQARQRLASHATISEAFVPSTTQG